MVMDPEYPIEAEWRIALRAFVVMLVQDTLSKSSRVLGNEIWDPPLSPLSNVGRERGRELRERERREGEREGKTKKRKTRDGLGIKRDGGRPRLDVDVGLCLEPSSQDSDPQ